MYEEEKVRILGVIGRWIVAIEHVGSTAVPGLGAKPIIDIITTVRQLTDVDHCIRPLEEIGYEYLGERGISGGCFFRKPPGNRMVRIYHLHIVEQTNDAWESHILFRDYLRAHPRVAREYYRFKRNLAIKYGSDREAYTEAKTSFIESVLSKARAWKRI